MTRTLTTLLVGSIGLFAVACSSAPPPKAELASSPQTSQPADKTPDKTVDKTLVAAAGAPATLPTPAAPEGPPEGSPTATSASVESAPPAPPVAEPKFFPIDVITGPEMAYLIDYANSGASVAVKKSCSGKVEEDANKHAECLTKGREKFGADVLRFKKDDKGRVKLFIYRRSGSALAELFTASVDLKEMSPNLVKVELKGGNGQRPILRDRASFEVKVPNGYSIEIEDAIYGRLAYDAKVGLVK